MRGVLCREWTRAADIEMDPLAQLSEAVAQIVTRPAIQSVVDTLRNQLQHTPEPFVWSTIDLQSISTRLPDGIRSGWIFVLRKDTPSGCHYHPNSIQHMVMIDGEGTSRVGMISGEMKRFGEPDCWYVIPEGVAHEVFPRGGDIVVVSFHTCEAHELQEVSCDSGVMREYEPRQ